jgi:hypothetical protein
MVILFCNTRSAEGRIAGIVIGVVVGCIVIGVVVYCVCIKKRRQQKQGKGGVILATKSPGKITFS